MEERDGENITGKVVLYRHSACRRRWEKGDSENTTGRAVIDRRTERSVGRDVLPPLHSSYTQGSGGGVGTRVCAEAGEVHFVQAFFCLVPQGLATAARVFRLSPKLI